MPIASRPRTWYRCRHGDTAAAQIAEVDVLPDGTVQVVRVTAVVDCGIAISPTVCAQWWKEP